jgi:ArsR family metal-binding transcriptional regulator
MYPLKSISGVLVAGDMDIHRFKPKFTFCKNCKEHKCVSRLAILERENA